MMIHLLIKNKQQMKKKYFKQIIVAALLFFSSYSNAQTLLNYWNFNTATTIPTITIPTASAVPGANIVAINGTANGQTSIIEVPGEGQDFAASNLNARNGDLAGNHLRFNNPRGGILEFSLPTTDFQGIIVKFVTRRSSAGATTQIWTYTINGTDYLPLSNVSVTEVATLETLDLSAIAGVNNNPNFKLRVSFSSASATNTGNNRFDNFTTEGTAFVSGPDTIAPTAAFFPVNGATNAASNVKPTIKFNENVRLLNNDAITNTNVDAVVELRLNNASGTTVPFDATFASNTITITPTSILSNNQMYYVALVANTIEDESNNAISTTQSATFSTPLPTVSLSVSNNVGTEAGTTNITVRATASTTVNGDQTVNLGVAGTNITSGDYALSSTTITILNGQSTGTVSFTVINDVLTENTEAAILTISNPSSGIILGTTISQSIIIIDNETPLNINLSNYVRVGRYDLPEPTRTAAPANNLLAQEVSGVTYNWDTDTLFLIGDGSTAVVQISKTGQLIDSMTLAQGASPQGTEFYDTEGITYIGGGQFVICEERDRKLVKFTYAPGTTLVRSAAQTVTIGTAVGNVGTEGLSYDPLTGGYIVLKEITPIRIFQTGVDFAAGTATNGSAMTVNSTNLFDPALMGFTDVADVFALSNIPALSGQPLNNNLLVISQENARIVNIDRNGVIANSLTIVSDPGNPLNAADQQHEGLTMDRDGILYVTNENGGGGIAFPQLWVYAPSSLQNFAPTAIALANTTTSILENSNTSGAVKVSDILVTDDGLGTNTLSLSGADASSFQIIGASLFIKAGTVLDFETKTSYSVTINVDDTTVGATPDASVNYVLTITDVLVEVVPVAAVSVSEVAPWSSGTVSVAADWFEVTNNGSSPLDITGWKVDDASNLFANALTLNGITTIAPGESVIFLETSATNSATIIANFKTAWFGANAPANLQVGSYTGASIGLSTGGDAVNLYDALGALKANVTFGAATTNFSFNNAAGLNNTAITTLSQVGVNEAFAASNDALQIGSPGTVGKLFISEVAPWSSGNSLVAADWFEVTNTKAVAVDITGWRIDDNSQSPIGAAPLNGITSINPGESVIFIETIDLAGKTTAFLSNWFGTTPPAGLKIGSYSGSGGLGTAGDQVNLYNASTSNIPQSSVLFGASPAAAPFTTFDNSAGLSSLVTPVTRFSAVGVNGAFAAVNSATEIGSPGVFLRSAGSLSTDTFSALNAAFKVIAYPNPFDSTYQLDIINGASETVEMKVYDMAGKLVESRKINSTEINNNSGGNNYTSGIYNIILTQGKNTKTVRVVKK